MADRPTCPRCPVGNVTKTLTCDHGHSNRHEPWATFTEGWACFACFKPVETEPLPVPQTQTIPDRLF